MALSIASRTRACSFLTCYKPSTWLLTWLRNFASWFIGRIKSRLPSFSLSFYSLSLLWHLSHCASLSSCGSLESLAKVQLITRDDTLGTESAVASSWGTSSLITVCTRLIHFSETRLNGLVHRGRKSRTICFWKKSSKRSSSSSCRTNFG